MQNDSHKAVTYNMLKDALVIVTYVPPSHLPALSIHWAGWPWLHILSQLWQEHKKPCPVHFDIYPNARYILAMNQRDYLINVKGKQCCVEKHKKVPFPLPIWQASIV